MIHIELWRVLYIGTVRSLKKTEDVRHLYQLVPSPAYPLELVEANLLDDSTWAGAVADCDTILHTASPFVIEEPSDPNELIKPAVDGTLSVLRAAAARGGIRRVVLTSSEAAISSGYTNDAVKGNGYVFDEKSWSHVPGVGTLRFSAFAACFRHSLPCLFHLLIIVCRLSTKQNVSRACRMAIPSRTYSWWCNTIRISCIKPFLCARTIVNRQRLLEYEGITAIYDR
jgi:hypothetical protein